MFKYNFVLFLGVMLALGCYFAYLDHTGQASKNNPVTRIIGEFRYHATAAEMRSIRDQLQRESQMGQNLPDEIGFSEWLQSHFVSSNKTDTTLDQFGNSYNLRRDGNTCTIISYGKDGEPDTDDDISISFDLEDSVL